MLRKIFFLMILVLFSISLFGQDYITKTLDPNGDNAPAEIKSLGLSFATNSVDILPPKIIKISDSEWAVLYMKSSTDTGDGYLLFFNPFAESDGDAFIKAVEVGENPYQMTMTPDGEHIWVLNQGDLTGENSSISIVNLNTLEVDNTIDLSGYEFSLGSNMVFSSDGKYCYLDSSIMDLDRNSKLLKIDCNSLSIVDEIFLGQGGPGPITMSHDGTFLCVVNPGEDTVSIVDLETFSETHRIHFIDQSTYQQGEHIPNFTYYTNVLLTPDDSIGFISSIGHQTPTPVQPLDKIYYFDPHSGEKLLDDNGDDICFEVTSNPGHLEFDPSGNYIICESGSYNTVDSVGTHVEGTAGVLILDWQNVTIEKAIYMPSYLFNMSSLSKISVYYDENNKLKVVFPCFSTFDVSSTPNVYETLVDFDSTPLKNISDVTPYNTSETRMMPVEVYKLSNNSFFVVNFLTNNFSIATLNENNPKLQVIPNFLFESNVFSSVAFINDSDEQNTYTMKPYLASYIDTEKIRGSSTPFYYLDENSEPVYINSFDLTLNPHQQYVRMASELTDGLQNITNQHGFLRVSTNGDLLKGVSFNGLFDDNDNIIAGDYYNINGNSYDEAIFPYIIASQDSSNRIYFFNPYMNTSKILLTYYNGDGTVADVGNFTPTIVFDTGVGLPVNGSVEDGYLFVRNKYNLSIPMYEAAMTKDHGSYSFFTCPPLYPYNNSSIEKLIVPFFAVGEGYDTHLILISYNNNTDDNGNPLVTNANISLYDVDGNLLLSKDFQFNNLSKFQINFSGEDLLNCDKYKSDITTGYAVITVDRDNVVGAFDFKMYHSETDDNNNTYDVLDNMAAAPITHSEEMKDSYTFPFAINISPYITSYVVLNPSDVENSYHIEVYDSDGNLVTQSVDFTLQPGKEKAFFIDDPELFTDPISVENFVGYMKIVSDSGVAFSTLSVQSTPDMMAIIPYIR